MKKNKERLQFKRRTRRVLNTLLWLGAFAPVFAIIILFSVQSEEEMPSMEMLENPPELLASIVFADDGKTELGRYWSINRTSVEYNDISPYVIDALIATEDERFIGHPGIDLKAVIRAATSFGGSGGASTITQQLAKLLFTLQERNRIAELKAAGEPVEKQYSGMRKRINEKAKENIIAIRLEKRYTKEEIITMYLNQFDFLYNAVGIENATKVYFNKGPTELTKSEAAMLVGMCKNPSLYNPHTYQVKDYKSAYAIRNNVSVLNVSDQQAQDLKTKDSVRAIERRNQVLFQWRRNTKKNNPSLKNTLTQEEYDSLKLLPVFTNYQIVDHKEGLAPYFRESLRAEITALFKQKDKNGTLLYKKGNGTSYNIYRDGLKIYTSINVSMQEYAEKALKRHLKEDLQPQFDKNNARVKRFPFADHYEVTDKRIEGIMNRARKRSDRYRILKDIGWSNKKIEESFQVPLSMKLFSWNGEIDTVLNPNDSIRYYKSILRAGLLSMDPNTGFVKAWVGGVDFKHFSYDHVKQSKRQVGSTIKPFVYSTALTMEVVKPCTRFDSGNPMCVEYGPSMSRRWCPRGNIPGNATVAMGLAVSSNAITAVVMEKMGGNAGPKNISKLLKSLEINLRPEDEVPSMCLGIMDLSLYQIVGAQSMFVNHGIYIRPTTILRIEDRNGNVIYNADPHTKEVLNSGIAYTTLTMMKGVVQFGTAGSLRSTRKWGGIRYPMAGKTGTTQNNADGWFMGLTPDLVTGIWVGAEDRDVRFRSMAWGQGARMALPIYGYYMQQVYKDGNLKISKEDFTPPLGFDASMYDCTGDNIPENMPIF
jgi:penicillin-binding protein 1A